MASLTQHTMINKWDDDINEAITSVGGDTYGAAGLPDYAEIIKTQLVSNDAVGKGIYQDFLYIDDKNQTSPFPWDGEPTDSTNAVHANTLAVSIKQLFETMALTERFKVYLVDELPISEIDLSAIYLIRSKCECGNTIENNYEGCYYVKTGKTLKKIDIPEFSLDLSKLFFLPRSEYEAGLSDYMNRIEELLRQKFGKYWDDEGFALDEVLDQMVEDIKTDLKTETDNILESVRSQIDEAVGEAVGKLESDFSETVEKLENEFEILKTEVEGEIKTKLDEVDTKLESVDTKLNEVDTKLESVDTKLNEVDTKLESVDTKLDEVETRVDQINTDINAKFDELQNETSEQFAALTEEINTKVDIIDGKIESHKSEYEDLKNNVENLTTELEQCVKKEDLIALDENEIINELK